jgi:uncharacterized protein YigE (DUF2233 family)
MKEQLLMLDGHLHHSPLIHRLKYVAACVITICTCGAPLPGSAGVSDVAWERLTTGIQVTLWNPVNACPQVPSMLILQVDPERFRFSIHYFRDEGLHAPLSITGWQQRTDAYVVFNAGLFREDYSYLGLLLKEGRSLGGKKHHSWQGLFAAEPTDNTLRKARVLDLAFEEFTEDRPSYREAAQSLMLLDRTGKLRVRDSGKRAYQTVVAEDNTGAILVMKTADIVSLHDLADCLHQQMPSIQQAMAMDGGSSSDIVGSPDLLHASQNLPPQTAWRPLLEGHLGVHVGLPAVIGISPRTGMQHISSPSASTSSRNR